MKTLLIDNYDSFSHILYQYLWEVNGQEPIFIHNDELTLSEIQNLQFDSILISPGPGRPDQKKDFGICLDVLRAFPLCPTLGICLGHQGLGFFSGAKIITAPIMMHGKKSLIKHSGKGIFQGLPQDFSAMRYHSLVIDSNTCPESVQITAQAQEDKQIMGIQIKGKPSFGLQFHPDSIGTEMGMLLLKNFRDLALKELNLSKKNKITPAIKNTNSPSEFWPKIPAHFTSLSWQDPESVFSACFKKYSAAFWLDGNEKFSSQQFSYMGTGQRLIEIKGNKSQCFEIQKDKEGKDFFKTQKTHFGDPLEFLQTYLNEKSYLSLVGYFGYEINSPNDSNNFIQTTEKSIPISDLKISDDINFRSMPDGLFILPDRILIFDHSEKKVYTDSNFPDWENVQTLMPIVIQSISDNPSLSTEKASSNFSLPWKLNKSKKEYLSSIENLQASIRRGETYEACLTNEIFLKSQADPFYVYRLLRQTNPAPYAAYLQFPQGCVLSSSPERFLKLESKDFILTSRPIKGTRRRGETEGEDKILENDLKNHAKDQSENAMIVDLVRNDFSKVCELGSVQVPEFLKVEKYATVFQLVSEVSGKLSADKNALDAFRACFPGGSMTGAPKKRTVELLAKEEERRRGVFSGALGYIDEFGQMDLGMIIRTLVYRNGFYSIGCGGAILDESDPEIEFEEAMLKAFACQRAVELAELGHCPGFKILDLESPRLHD